MNPFYELVPISDAPKKDGWYYVANPNMEILPRMIYFRLGEWDNYHKLNVSYWLKPHSDKVLLSREELEDMIGDFKSAIMKMAEIEYDGDSPIVSFCNEETELYKQQLINQLLSGIDLTNSSNT